MILRIVDQVQNFPWNGFVTKDINSDRVRVVLSRDDAYVAFDASKAIMKTSIELQTIHECVIVCPERCLEILNDFVQ